MSRKTILVGTLAIAAVAFSIIAGCKADSVAAPEKICTPGNYVFCRCKDRSEGTKLCIEDGTGFEPCDGCLSGTDDGNGNGNGNGMDDGGDDTSTGTDAPVDTGPPVTARPQVGQLFITEIMYDPSGNEPTDEWFEVLSTATGPVNLNGMFLKDGAGRVHVLGPTPELTLQPNQNMLLVRNQPAAVAAGLPSNRILGEYGTGDSDTGGILLTNGSTGAIAMIDGATEIVRVPYGAFGYTQAPPGGTSIQLKTADIQQSLQASGWCLAGDPWPGQPSTKDPKDFGTPGRATSCP